MTVTILIHAISSRSLTMPCAFLAETIRYGADRTSETDSYHVMSIMEGWKIETTAFPYLHQLECTCSVDMILAAMQCEGASRTARSKERCSDSGSPL